MELSLPPADVMFASIEKAIAEAEAQRKVQLQWNQENLLTLDAIAAHDGKTPARLNFLSLSAWLALAKKARIRAIPATPLGSLSTAAFEDAINNVPNDDVVAFLALASEVTPGHMVRFEQCGPGSLKGSLSNGEGVSDGTITLHNGGRVLDIFDPRTYETYLSLGMDRFTAYKRPIVDAQTHHDTWVTQDWEGERRIEGDWPVEFRVYVREGMVTGVSNYYPQMTLPETYLHAARKVAARATTMTAVMHALKIGVGNAELCGDWGADPGSKRAAWVPEHWGPQDFTMDFLLTKSDDVLFLEAGPGGFRAAAPCCFENGPFGPEALHGIKLGLDSPVHPL